MIDDVGDLVSFPFQAKMETKALKAKRPGFTDERYMETAYFVENGMYDNAFFC